MPNRSCDNRCVSASNKCHNDRIDNTCQPSVACTCVHSSCKNRCKRYARNNGDSGNVEQARCCNLCACIDEVGIGVPQQDNYADYIEYYVDCNRCPFGKVFYAVVLAHCACYHVEDEEERYILQHCRYANQIEYSKVKCPEAEVYAAHLPNKVHNPVEYRK